MSRRKKLRLQFLPNRASTTNALANELAEPRFGGVLFTESIMPRDQVAAPEPRTLVGRRGQPPLPSKTSAPISVATTSSRDGWASVSPRLPARSSAKVGARPRIWPGSSHAWGRGRSWPQKSARIANDAVLYQKSLFATYPSRCGQDCLTMHVFDLTRILRRGCPVPGRTR
jgi:hypothetical protein